MENGKNNLKRNVYIIEYKLYILKIAETKILYYIEDTFGLSRETVYEWRNNKDKLEQNTKKKFLLELKEVEENL